MITDEGKKFMVKNLKNLLILLCNGYVIAFTANGGKHLPVKSNNIKTRKTCKICLKLT